jgi:hypothetical protein
MQPPPDKNVLCGTDLRVLSLDRSLIVSTMASVRRHWYGASAWLIVAERPAPDVVNRPDEADDSRQSLRDVQKPTAKRIENRHS